MYLRTLGLILLFVTQVGLAQGRKPAVEDFVGIEVDHPKGTPQGTEGLFNFESEMDKFETVKKNPTKKIKSVAVFQSNGPNNLTTIFAIAFALVLPCLIWVMMMKNLRQKAHIESASNIEVLEKYRLERQEARKSQEDFKKAS